VSQEFYDITINNYIENERYASLGYAERNSFHTANVKTSVVYHAWLCVTNCIGSVRAYS